MRVPRDIYRSVILRAVWNPRCSKPPANCDTTLLRLKPSRKPAHSKHKKRDNLDPRSGLRLTGFERPGCPKKTKTHQIKNVRKNLLGGLKCYRHLLISLLHKRVEPPSYGHQRNSAAFVSNDCTYESVFSFSPMSTVRSIFSNYWILQIEEGVISTEAEGLGG